MEWESVSNAILFFSRISARALSFVQEGANTVGNGIGIDLGASFSTDTWNRRAAPASADRIHAGSTRISSSISASREGVTTGAGRTSCRQGGKPATHSCGSTSASALCWVGKERERIVSGWPLESPCLPAPPPSGFCQGGTRSLARAFVSLLPLLFSAAATKEGI